MITLTAQSKESPQLIRLGAEKLGQTLVTINTNVSTIVVEDETFYQYDAYSVWVVNRPNITQYVTDNLQFFVDKVVADDAATKTVDINKAVNQYIYRHYDSGTQHSFTALYVNPATTEEQKDRLMLVWQWIASVMGYYYQKKASLEPFDFSPFDATVPSVSLSEFIA